ncbi:MAG: protease, partial [Humisphaera sp.]|nr:protease [Humisphaera sp.]
MAQSLTGKKVAILCTDGFEQVEMTAPRKALEEAGAGTDLVCPKDDGKVRAWNFTEWGDTFKVDVKLAEADPEDYDAILMPGGVLNPDTLRINTQALDFVRAFFAAGKPCAAI